MQQIGHHLGKNATNTQNGAMEDGVLYYEEDPVLTVYILFRISVDAKLFSEDAEPFTKQEMASKIIPKNLMSDSRIDYICQGGKDLRDEEDLIRLMESIRDAEDFTINTVAKARDVLSDENAAIEESRASIIPSAAESHVQGDIGGIATDLQRLTEQNERPESNGRNRKNEAHATDRAVHQQNHATKT